MEPRLERQARNESLLREINERIQVVKGRAEAPADELFEFLCECGREEIDSTVTVQLTMPEYEEVRAQNDRFAVYPGHENPELERVVKRNERYALVDKVPEAQPFVENDLRGAPSQ